MSTDHFSKVRELFALALEQPAPEREAFVRAQASDPVIAAEVLRLMGLDEQPQIHTLQGVQAMADAEAAPLAQGRRVGKFELFDVLGEGGMGQVYRARRVDGPEHWVAVKLMRRGLFNAASETRFLAEQQFLARLNHPNIAHYIDSGSDTEGHVYVAMELVQGQRLLDFAKTKELNAKQRVTLFRQLLAAVSYAHRQLIIHRDLKQANVLVNPDGVVKLLDFGIAKLLQDQSQMTGTIERLYTPTCAAPEQIRGEPCDVTTDVYALGVLLYELIAGKSIFDTEGKTPGEFENLVLNVPPSDMKSRVHPELGCADIPTDLERIVAKAIRKEPNRRYGSVEQFDADLERLLNNEPVSGNGFLYRAQKFLSRNKLASGLTALIGIAVLSGLIITLQQNREIRAERDRANLALDAMKQAFLGADPGGEAGGEVTAKDILDKSTENLLPLLKSGDPTFLDLATTLFEVQLSMGQVDSAARTYQSMGGDKIATTPHRCLLAAKLYSEQRAEARAAAMLEGCQPTSPADRQLALLVKARLAARSVQYALAAKYYREITDSLEITDPNWANAIHERCNALAHSKQASEAFSVLAAAKLKAEASLPPEHITHSRLKLVRLSILEAIGDLDEVMKEGPKIVNQVRSKFSENSVIIHRMENAIGLAFLKAQRYKEAIPHLEKAKKIAISLLGAKHHTTLRNELNLLLAMGRDNSMDQIVTSRFEQLIIDSIDPDLKYLHAYAKFAYADWQLRRSQFEPMLRILVAIDDNGIDLNFAMNRARYQDHLRFAYWNLPCDTDPTQTYDQYRVCSAAPTLNSLCLKARERLCGEPPSLL